MRRALDDEWFEPAEESARQSLLVESLMSLATSQVANLKTLFELADGDGGGELSYDELRDLFESCDIWLRKEQLLALFRSMDKDGDGGVSIGEFQTFFESAMTASSSSSTTTTSTSTSNSGSGSGSGSGNRSGRADVAIDILEVRCAVLTRPPGGWVARR